MCGCVSRRGQHYLASVLSRMRSLLRFLSYLLFNTPMRTRIPIGLLVSASVVFAGEPRIQVAGPDTIDFGKYPAWEKRVANFKIWNAGDAPLKIIKVRKNCGCASASCDKVMLKPGETGTVEVVILPSSIFGLFSKNTFIETDDKANRFLKLNVAGHPVPLVEVKPRASMHAGRLQTGKAWTQNFELRPPQSGVTLGAPKVTSTHKAEATLASGGGERKLSVKILPTSQAGDLTCDIEIPVLTPTNHAAVKLSITGRIGAELVPVPQLALLKVADKPVTRSFLLRVVGQRTRVLDPKALLLPEIKGVTFSAAKAPDGKNLSLTATFGPDFTKQLLADEIIPFSVSVPGLASAQIICKIQK